MEAPDGEGARPRLFKVTIKWAATIDVQALVDFARYAALAMTSIFSKVTAVKFYDMFLPGHTCTAVISHGKGSILVYTFTIL